MNTAPDKSGSEDASATLDHLFEEWEKQESHVDLSDVKPEDSIVFVVFWALAIVVFLQFFTRYVLNSSWGWTEEIARYLLIGTTFLGSIYAMRKGTHISVEAALKPLKPSLRHWILTAVDLVVFLFSALMTWNAAQLALKTNQFMVTIEVSKSVVYWTCSAAFAGMSIYAFLRLMRRLARKESDELHSLTID